MPAHTHDGVDWAARLADLRQADAANATALRAVADRLIEALPAPHPTVIDVGSGAGGMSAALAAALASRAARATAYPIEVPPAAIPPAAIPPARSQPHSPPPAAIPPAAVAPAAALPGAVSPGAVLSAATPVAGDGPAGRTQAQTGAVAETGQSTPAAATARPVATPLAPAAAPLATNPNPAGADQPAGTVAETGHSTAPSTTGPKHPADDSRSAESTSAAAHPDAASDRSTDTPVRDSHAATTSVVAQPGADSGRSADIPIHDSSPAATSVAAHPGVASGVSSDAPVQDSRSVAGTSAARHSGTAARHPVRVAVHDSRADVPPSMPAHPGSATLVLVDVVPELLAAAEETAVAAVGGSAAVAVRTVRADVADPASLGGLPSADLVWASNVVHHLPDQRAAVLMLAGLLAPGGCLALSEGGLSMRCLPWDLGVGEPGLQDRLIAAHGIWFQRMRADMPDAVRLPVGWNRVLGEAGLRGVTAFSYLVDVPAPLSEDGRSAVVSWLSWMSHPAADLLGPADVAALGRLLDPDDPAYVAHRDDIFMLKASTVHLGWR